MKCDDCQPLLIDLVCDELDAATAAQVRAHAKSCERCGPDLRVLEEGMEAGQALPRLEAPRGVREFVLEEARRQTEAAKLRTEPPVGPAAHESSDGVGLGWLGRFAELAMSPQVAMVAVLLLMISVGLYYLPGPEPETAQSTLRIQEEGLDDEADGDQAASATAVPVTAEPESEPEPELAEEEEKAEQAPAAERKAAEAQRSRRSAPNKRSPARKRAKSPARSASGFDDSARQFAAPPPAAKPQATADEDMEAAEGRREAAPAEAETSNEGLGGLTKGTSAGSPPGGFGSGVAAEARAVDEGARTLELAKQAQAQGRYAEAARLAETALRRGADAIQAHALAARAHRRAGNCRGAAPHYVQWRKLLRRLPAAWPEAVRCFDAIGDTQQVESWLAEAERTQPEQATQVRESLRATRSKRSTPQAAPAALEAQ